MFTKDKKDHKKTRSSTLKLPSWAIKRILDEGEVRFP